MILKGKRLAVAITLSALAGILAIHKVFHVPGCVAFDDWDDRNHTLVNFYSAREAERAGDSGHINLFNNFGTPLLGDAISFASSPHAITYRFFSGPTAMAINRFAAAAVTFFLFLLFFSHYLSFSSAALAAALSIFSGGFIWHMAHHHYQMTLLPFAAALCLIAWYSRLERDPSPRDRVAAFALASVLFSFNYVSSNVTTTVPAVPLLLAAALILGGKRRWEILSILVGGIVVGIAVAFPELHALFSNLSQSVRQATFYGEGFHYTLVHLGLSTLGWIGNTESHIDYVLYLSFPIALLFGAGVWLAAHRPERRPLLLCFLLLGLLPTASVWLLLWSSALWKALPFVRSADISRVIWFSMPFLGFGAFWALDRIREGESAPLLSKRLFQISAVLVVALGVTKLIFALAFPYHLIIAVILLGWGLGPRPLARMLGALCFVALLASPWKILGLTNFQACASSHPFSEAVNVQPLAHPVLSRAVAGRRVAADLNSGLGFDLTALFGGFLGAGGRSIVMDHGLEAYLLSQGLIERDDRLSGYHFRPVEAARLAPLGIEYFVAPESADLTPKGWRLIDTRQGLSLYENATDDVTPFFIDNSSRQYLKSYVVRQSSAEVTLPDRFAGGTLVATFSERPGWNVWTDGQPSFHFSGPDRLIRIALPAGAKKVELKFVHPSAALRHSAFASALGLFLLLAAVFRSQRKLSRRAALVESHA